MGWARTLFALLGLLAGIFSSDTVRAQGALTNGWTHLGLIAPGGEVDSWTFSANVGDRIVIRVGEITQTNTFTPHIRLMTPTGVQQATANGAVAAEVSVVATKSGTFTVMIDGVAANATGAYRLALAKTPGTVSVALGNEGGPMINGATHTGTIGVGDLDVWTLTANSGDSITVRIGEITDINTFTPWVRLYSPDGAWSIPALAPWRASSFSGNPAAMTRTSRASSGVGTILPPISPARAGRS